MKIRCDIHVNGQAAKLILVKKPEETVDHLALKLAAYLMFVDRAPVVEPSSEHPALGGFDMRPDLMALNAAGEVVLWVECGAVTRHKVGKVSRRFPAARFVILKATAREAERLRAQLREDLRRPSAVEIWTWPDGGFAAFRAALMEKTEVFGEAGEKIFNLTMNQNPLAQDLLAF